jgi:hypothetical protein
MLLMTNVEAVIGQEKNGRLVAGKPRGSVLHATKEIVRLSEPGFRSSYCRTIKAWAAFLNVKVEKVSRDMRLFLFVDHSVLCVLPECKPPVADTYEKPAHLWQERKPLHC